MEQTMACNNSAVGKGEAMPILAFQSHQIWGEVLFSNGRNKHTISDTTGGVMQRFMYNLLITPNPQPHRVLYKIGRDFGMNEN